MKNVKKKNSLSKKPSANLIRTGSKRELEIQAHRPFARGDIYIFLIMMVIRPVSLNSADSVKIYFSNTHIDIFFSFERKTKIVLNEINSCF